MSLTAPVVLVLAIALASLQRRDGTRPFFAGVDALSPKTKRSDAQKLRRIFPATTCKCYVSEDPPLEIYHDRSIAPLPPSAAPPS